MTEPHPAHERPLPITLGSSAASLRRSLGAQAWCALECLAARATTGPDGTVVAASVRALAAELGVAYAGIALVTDYDSGVDGEPGIAPVTQDAVFAAFAANLEQLKAVLHRAIALVPFGGAPGSAS